MRRTFLLPLQDFFGVFWSLLETCILLNNAAKSGEVLDFFYPVPFAVTQVSVSPVDLHDSWGQRHSQQWALEFSIRSSPRLSKLIEVGFQTIPKSLQLSEEFLGVGTWARFSSVFCIH